MTLILTLILTLTLTTDPNPNPNPNPNPDQVAEALAHSNEFLDLQLLIGLQSSRPFDHGVSVSASKREGPWP